MRDAAERDTLTPPALAAEWGVAPEKIIGLIERGELVAFNAALRAAGKRKRWRIRRAEVEAFEARRAAKPQPARSPRRRADADGETFGF